MSRVSGVNKSLNNFSLLITVLLIIFTSVQAHAFNERYQVFEGGSVVRDLVTGLEWQRCSVGQLWDGDTCVGEAIKYSWSASLNMTSLGGYHLPSIDQLATLLYCVQSGRYFWEDDYTPCGSFDGLVSSVNNQYFPNTPGDWFWSATPGDSLNGVMGVHFGLGDIFVGLNSSGHVRLVRAAQDTTPPTVPGNLNATGVSTSMVTLSWSASTDSVGSGLAGYRIESCSGESCTNFQPISFADASETRVTHSGLTAGTVYRYRIRAVDAEDNMSAYTSTVQASTLTASELPNAPVNDHFSAALILSGTRGTVTGTNIGSTSEDQEPMHAGISNSSSVWWRWTAPESGSVTIDTFGSDYDTVLAAYSGQSMASLLELASNDDASGTYQSLVSFEVVSGVTYHIAVDGWRGDVGDIVLNYQLQADDQVGLPGLSSFSAERYGRNAVRLSWETSSLGQGVTRVAIERCVGVDCYDFTGLVIIDFATGNHLDSSLRAGTMYRYRATTADDADNVSADAVVVEAHIEQVAPSKKSRPLWWLILQAETDVNE